MKISRIILLVLICTSALCQGNNCPSFNAGDRLQSGISIFIQAKIRLSVQAPQTDNTSLMHQFHLLCQTQDSNLQSVHFSSFSNIYNWRLHFKLRIQLPNFRSKKSQLKLLVNDFDCQHKRLELSSSVLVCFGKDRLCSW